MGLGITACAYCFCKKYHLCQAGKYNGVKSILNRHYCFYGGFQVVDLIITELKNHMTCYKFEWSHWFELQHSDWRANLVKDFVFTNKFSTNEST